MVSKHFADSNFHVLKSFLREERERERESSLEINEECGHFECSVRPSLCLAVVVGGPGGDAAIISPRCQVEEVDERLAWLVCWKGEEGGRLVRHSGAKIKFLS